MLQITGQVVNIFTVEGGTDKEGKDFNARHKVQLMGNVALPSGDNKFDLMDLTVEDLAIWSPMKGKQVSIEIGAFAPAKGSIIYFVRKGSKPRLVSPAVA